MAVTSPTFDPLHTFCPFSLADLPPGGLRSTCTARTCAVHARCPQRCGWFDLDCSWRSRS